MSFHKIKRWSCDRCGETSEVEEQGRGDHLVPKWTSILAMPLAASAPASMYPAQHLCEKCIEEFEQWMHPSVILPDPDEVSMSISEATERILSETADEPGYSGKRRKEEPTSPFIEGLMAKNQQGRWEIVTADATEIVVADGFVSQEAAAAWWHERVEHDDEAPRNVTYRISPRSRTMDEEPREGEQSSDDVGAEVRQGDGEVGPQPH